MKRVIWTGSSHDDLAKFPKVIRNAMGYALYRAQLGERHEHTRVLQGMGNAKIIEIREWNESGTYRTIYTVEFKEYIFVLHAFQKKSKTGIETPKKEIDLLKARLKEAKQRYSELKGVS